MSNESKLLNQISIFKKKIYRKDCRKCEPKRCFEESSHKFLYEKYSSSQNYFYSKEIGDIVENQQRPSAIHFKDY